MPYHSSFPHQTGWQFPTGTCLKTGASNARVIWKNHDFRPISRFISQMMQDTAITAPKLSNGTSLNDLQWPFQGHDYSTSNNLKMVQHTAILTMADQWNAISISRVRGPAATLLRNNLRQVVLFSTVISLKFVHTLPNTFSWSLIPEKFLSYFYKISWIFM